MDQAPGSGFALLAPLQACRPHSLATKSEVIIGGIVASTASEKGFSHSGKLRGMDQAPGSEFALLAPLQACRPHSLATKSEVIIGGIVASTNS